ncbi:hypothetical protein ALC57_02214, partial [Trachymyrmex cornetzi]
IARVCSKHFDSSQYKDTLWLRRILPTYSPVNSRKLKPNAIPMEFVEEAQAIVKNDLGSSQVSYDNAKIQQLIQENADLLLKNKVLQQQLARKNKLFKKEMKKKFQDMLSPFFTPGQIKMTLNPMQKMTVQSLRHFD